MNVLLYFIEPKPDDTILNNNNTIYTVCRLACARDRHTVLRTYSLRPEYTLYNHATLIRSNLSCLTCFSVR